MTVDLYPGYLNLGGNELINNPRVWALMEAAGCVTSVVRNECPNLYLAMDPEGIPYTEQTVQTAPWYDPDAAEVSSGFYGAYAIDVEQMHDSTREADIAQSILNGGTIGRVRLATKEVRVRAMLFADDSESLEYGRTWLKWASFPDACGQHGDRCGLTDLQFFTGCPPDPVIDRIEQPLRPVWRNMAQNPSFEAGVGAPAIVARNHYPTPSFETQVTPPANTTRTNQLLNPSVEGGLTDWLAWAATTTISLDTTEKHSGTQSVKAVNAGTAAGEGVGTQVVVAGTTGKLFSVGAWVKAPFGAPLRLWLRSGTGSGGDKSFDVDGTGQWQFVKIEGGIGVAAADRMQLSVRTRSIWAGTFWMDDAIIEFGPTVGAYFDGSTPATGYTRAWTGTPNASTSTEVGPARIARTNLAQNPSFEATLGLWVGSGSNIVRDSAEFHDGVISCKVTCTVNTSVQGDVRLSGTGQTILPYGFEPGKTYTVSAWIKTPAAHASFDTTASSRQRRITAFISTSGGAYVESFGAQATNTAGTWQRISHTFTLGASVTGMILAIGCAGSTTDTSFVTYVDGVLIEEVGTLGAYFDGETLALQTAATSYGWSGAVWGSASHQYNAYEIRKNLTPNPNFVGTAGLVGSQSGSGWTVQAGVGAFSADGVFDTLATVTATLLPFEYITYYTPNGSVISAQRTFSVPLGSPPVRLRLAVVPYQNGGTNSGGSTGTVTYNPEGIVQIESGETRTLKIEATIIPAGFNGIRTIAYLENTAQTNRRIIFSDAQVEIFRVATPPFNGGTPAAGDFTYEWTNVPNNSVSVARAPRFPVGTTTDNLRQVMSSTEWVSSGQRSIRIRNGGVIDKNTYAYLVGGPSGAAVAGKTFTLIGTVRITAAQAATPHSYARSIRMQAVSIAQGTIDLIPAGSGAAPNAPGVYQVRHVVTFPADTTNYFFRPYGGQGIGESDVWWDDVAMVEAVGTTAPYTGPYFDGSTTTDDATHAWAGTVNNSTSTRSRAVAPNAGVSPAGSALIWSDQRGPSQGLRFNRWMFTTTAPTTITVSDAPGVAAGALRTGLVYLRLVRNAEQPAGSDGLTVTVQPMWRNAAGTSESAGDPFQMDDQGWYQFAFSGSPAIADAALAFVISGHPVGAGFDIDQHGTFVGIDAATTGTPYRDTWFSGATTDTTESLYEWDGATNASTSTQSARTYVEVPNPEQTAANNDALTRFLHGVAITSGPTTVQDYVFSDGLVAQEVEFTVVSERPWSYGKTRTVDLPTTESSVIQDIPFNLVPYPTAEIDNGVAVIVSQNLSTNPSVEANATGWTATATPFASEPAVASYFTSGRSTDLAAAGTASMRARILGNGSTTVTDGQAQVIIEHPVPLGGTGTARRMSLSGWAATLIAAGGTASRIDGMRAVVNWSAGGSVDLGVAVPGEFGGRVFSAKSVPVPDAATTVTLQFIFDVTWGSSATPALNSDLRLYADAVAVTIP